MSWLVFAIKLEFGKCDVLRPESLTDTWGSHLLDLRNSSSKTWIPESSPQTSLKQKDHSTVATFMRSSITYQFN